jgi:hypothetical protein
MLLPKFSIRLLLGIMSVLGVLSVAFNYALTGRAWAISLFMALGMLLAMFVLYSLGFLVGSLFGVLDSAIRPPTQPTTPFATSQPPPQILPPPEPE